MRALIDTNVLVSVLLSPSSSKPPAAIIDHAFANEVELLVSETTLGELRGRIASKPYLASRLPSNVVDAFVQVLSEVAVIVPELDEVIPALSRDRKDDYLLMHAVTEEVEFLVTGDKDLLVLERIGDTRIMSPADFVRILDVETGD